MTAAAAKLAAWPPRMLSVRTPSESTTSAAGFGGRTAVAGRARLMGLGRAPPTGGLCLDSDRPAVGLDAQRPGFDAVAVVAPAVRPGLVHLEVTLPRVLEDEGECDERAGDG